MVFGLLRGWKRRRLLERSFPPHWEPFVTRWLPFVASLEPEEGERFRAHLKLFVWEKHWVGAMGLEVTEEMQVVIAGLAARLSRNLPFEVFERLGEVVLYSREFLNPADELGLPTHGEAHHFGTVVLSWESVLDGLAYPCEGYNPALHEFAHVLDYTSGYFDGTPILHDGKDYEPWARILSTYFESLRQNPEESFLDVYGAEDEAEFFAVATEAFFELPDIMAVEAPELFDVLKSYYRLDPILVPCQCEDHDEDHEEERDQSR
ncbi:MAG: zinc-dependent peptidase [Bradymonadaceae bacterium]